RRATTRKRVEMLETALQDGLKEARQLRHVTFESEAASGELLRAMARCFLWLEIEVLCDEQDEQDEPREDGTFEREEQDLDDENGGSEDENQGSEDENLVL